MNTPHQWQRLKAIVGTALEYGPAECRLYAENACAGDAALRAEVEALLIAYESPDALTHCAIATELFDPVGGSTEVGPFRLVRSLGEGGMGSVWLAEQTEPLQRTVAVKLLKGGLFDDVAIQRFLAERQSLAIMDHPAIAKVFEAGTTADGQPYLAMEYVAGLPITTYCDAQQFTLRERLSLFICTCEGVQHAHQKAVIHRDLKPANILVVEVDGIAMPRIIDFGLAQRSQFILQDPKRTHDALFMGTPNYASPEQAEPLGDSVDSRSDVYSLGVILYELLTGCLPFEPASGKALEVEEVLRELRESNPQPPSTRMSVTDSNVQARAKARRLSAEQLLIALRGDLDAITMKALEKDLTRRFQTPHDLASDIDRYLRGHAVEARSAGVLYRFGKYVKRHRLPVTAGALLVTMLVTFVIMQAVQLKRTVHERDRADRITEFMTRMYTVSNPGEARGNSITAREILDKSAQEIASGLGADPELKSQLLQVMGGVYQSLGLYSKAEPLLSQAITMRTSMFGAADSRTLAVKAKYALLLIQKGEYPAAERYEREQLEVERRVLGPDSRETLATLSNIFWCMDSNGKTQEAEPLGKRTLQRQQHALGPEDSDTLITMRRLGYIVASLDKFSEAEALTRDALTKRSRVSGPEHPETLLVASDLGWLLLQEDHLQEAERLLRNTLAAQQRILGVDHQNSIATANSLGATLQHEHKLEEAKQVYIQYLQIAKRTFGSENDATVMLMDNLATIYAQEHRYQDAEKGSREVLAIRLHVLGPANPDTALAQYNLAEVLHDIGNLTEAEQLYRRAYQTQRQALGPTHRVTLDSEYKLASSLVRARRSQEALATLRDAVEHGLLDDNKYASIQTSNDWRSMRNVAAFLSITDASYKSTSANAF